MTMPSTRTLLGTRTESSWKKQSNMDKFSYSRTNWPRIELWTARLCGKLYTTPLLCPVCVNGYINMLCFFTLKWRKPPGKTLNFASENVCTLWPSNVKSHFHTKILLYTAGFCQTFIVSTDFLVQTRIFLGFFSWDMLQLWKVWTYSEELPGSWWWLEDLLQVLYIYTSQMLLDAFN